MASYRRKQQEGIASAHFIQLLQQNTQGYRSPLEQTTVQAGLAQSHQQRPAKNRWNGRKLRANALKIRSFLVFLNNPLLALPNKQITT